MELTVKMVETISYNITITIDDPYVTQLIRHAVDEDGCAEPNDLSVTACDAIKDAVRDSKGDEWASASVDKREWSIVVFPDEAGE